jgi:hypothetical protein
MSAQVVFDFPALCAAHQVDERAVIDALKAILSAGHSPSTIESLSERARYSPRHFKRLLSVLRWSDPNGDIDPVIRVQRSKRGRGHAFRYVVIHQRAYDLGLISDAA